MTGWFGRRRARIALLVLVLALVGVTAASFVLLRGSSGSSGSTAGDRTTAAPDGLQASFLAATGVRTGAPTVVTGAVVNTGSTPRAASFSVDGLPVGSSLATVLPSANAPSADGEWWSCTTTTCTLTGAAGAATIGPSAGAQLLLAFEGVPTTPDVDVAITVDGVGTSSVPLQLAGGVPPLAADALGLSLVGGGTVLTGTPSTTAATVTNFASTAIAPGALTLGLTPPAIPGLSVAPSGAGWSCTATSCTNTAVVAPLAVTSPLLIAQSAPEGTASGEGTLAAVATVGVPAMQASASSSVTVRPPRSWTVGSRVFLDRGSIVGGSTLSATIEIVPTGRGLLTDTVDVGLDVPAGYVPDWTSTTSTGPFQCSSTGCSSTAPLTAGTQYLLTVPVAVPVDARPGTASMSDEVSVSDEEGSTPQRSSSVSFTVVPAPAASLRARLSGGVGTDVRGGAIGFAPGASRELQVVVTNEGGSPYRAGSAVYVTATPSTTEWLTSVGGDGWTCIPGTSGQVSPRWPLRCQQILRADLAPGASLSVPFALAPGEGGVGEWTIGTGTTMRTAAAAPTHARVEVQPHAPRLAVAIDQEQPIHDGGSGEIVVRPTNLGDRAAAGGVLAVMVPDDVELLSWAGPSWSCVDATVSGAGGSLLCSTTVIAEPGGRLPSLFLAVGVDGGTESVRLSAWASAVGQFDVEGIEPVTARFAVASAVDVDAGPEMTVATPVVGADGVAAPAVVTLVGSADLAAARNLQWTQLCLQPGAADCGSTVSPAVAWSGVPAGSVPNTVTARFTAPAGITAPTDLFFRLSGVVGSSSVSDVVVVHLVPASFSLTTSGDPTAIDSSANPIGVPQPGPPSSPSPPTATIAGSGAPMTVLTGAAAQLVGGGTGVGSLGYSWSQTSGPSAAIDGSSATSPILSFTAPVLAPDEDSVSLDFELTVTDSTGATATSSITVEVVWGDDGLQVALSAGAPNVVAPNVVASPGTPVTIAATVTSLGAPYTYDWDVEGIELPSGTDTGSASLSFAAGDSAIDGSAILTVTDRFGRVTTTSIPVIVSALPAGQVPTAFCQAVDALAAGSTASLSGAGTTVTIPTGSVSTPTCGASTIVTFDDASAQLPGGISLAQASGRLTIAGVSFSTATVSTPANWSLGPASIAPGGLLASFTSSSSIGVPGGSLTAATTPFVAPAGWTGTTSVVFTETPQPAAVLSATSTGSSSGQSLEVSARSVAGVTTAQLAGSGLVGIGPVDLPIGGTITTASSTAAPVLSVTASLGAPAAIGAGVGLASATLAWTPSQSSGPVVLTIGAGAQASTIAATATVTDAGTTLVVSDATTTWSTAAGAPPVRMSGTGSVLGGQVQLSLASAPVAPWGIAAQLALDSLQIGIAVDCPLAVSGPCGPTVSVTAMGVGPLFGAPLALIGSLDPSTGLVTMTGTPGEMTITPLDVAEVTLTVSFGPGGVPSATASGTSTVLGVAVPTSIDLGAAGTTAEAQLGSVTIAGGWTVAGVTAIASTAPFTFTATMPSTGATASVSIAPGALTGVAVAPLPSTLVAGVLPDALQTGLLSFSIGAAPVTSYTVAIPLPNPWYVTGGPGTDGALQVTSMTLTVTTGSTGSTVAVAGAGALTTAPTTFGTVVDTEPMTFTGSLAPGLLNLTFTGSTTPWTSAFGASGFVASDLSVVVRVTPSQTTATLTGSIALPAALAANIGSTGTTPPTFSADLTSPTVCAAIDLTGSGGVDIGGFGFLEAPSAYVVLAAAPCEVAGASVGAGLSVLLDGSDLGTDPGNVVLAVDPGTFALSVAATVPLTGLSFSVGGVEFTGASVTVGSDPGPVSIAIAGSMTVAGRSVTVPSTPITTLTTTVGGVSSTADVFQFSTTIDSLVLDWASIDGAQVTVTCPAVVTTAPGASAVTVSGTLPVLVPGGLAVDLVGTILGGEIPALTQDLPQQTYALWSSDSMAVPLTVSYTAATSTTASSLTIQSPATLDVVETTPPAALSIVEAAGATRTYDLVSVAVTSTGSGPQGGARLAITAATPYLTEGVTGSDATTGVVTGTYSVATGVYSFGASSLPGLLAGLSAPTDLSFERTASGTVSATQTSSLTPGIFDTDVTIPVSGNLGVLGSGPITSSATVNTLTGSSPGLTLRGLGGTASFSVAPTPPGQGRLTGYTDFEDSVSFATDPGSCTFWQGNPTLTGIVYASGGTTYYTLAGTTPTELALPLSFLSSSSTVNRQPIVVSNEVIPGSPPPTAGLTLAYPFSMTAFSGFGQVSLDFAACSFSVGGTAIMQLSAMGSAGQDLEQALGGPTGLQIQTGGLFGPAGELPPNVAVARAVLQAEEVSGALAAMAAQETQRAATLSTAAQTAQGQLDAANQQAMQAESELQTAQTALSDAEANAYLESFAAQYGTDALSLEAAEDNLLATAHAVAAATTQVELATTANEAARTNLETVQAQVETAGTAVADAENSAAEYQERSNQTAHPRILELTLDLTYCTTCQATFSVSIDGQFMFAAVGLFEFGFTYQYGPSGDAAEIDLGGGIEEQLQFSADIFGASANLELTVVGDVGLAMDGVVPTAVTDVSFTAQLQASVDVWASAWCCSWSAQLASATGQASLEVVPQPTEWSVSLELQVGPFDWDPSYGPAQF